MVYDNNELDSRVLQSLNDQLIKKNKEMEQLLARVAHELLTPVTSLMMTSDELLDHYEGLKSGDSPLYTTDQLLSFVQRISRSGKDLKSQALNILNHFTTSSDSVKTVLVNVTKIVNNLADELTPEATKNKITIIQDCIQDASVLTTEETIKTICRNLLSNAIKFTAANDTCRQKTVNISLSESDGNVNLVVVDSGIGMKQEFVNSELFSLGKRGDNATSREVRGYGVGLSTVEGLIDNLGGSIKYESEVNKGTKVFVTLPKDQDEEFTI